MAIFDRMPGEILEKLKGLGLGEPSESESEKFVLSQEEEIELQAEIFRQIEEEGEEDENLDIYDNKSVAGGNDGIVEVEYYGSIGYVDISFTSLNENISEVEYQRILNAVETITFDTNEVKWKDSFNEIESFGERAVMILFRECRKFNLSDEKQTALVVQLLNRLTNRSLKGRRTIKAILEQASIQQHVKLAILVSGTIRDKEVSQALITRLADPDYFTLALQSLLKLAPKDLLPSILEVINKIDLRRNDLIEHAFIHANEFVRFGPQAVKLIFATYASLDIKQLHRVYIRAIQSFKEDAIPFLKEVFQETKDEKMMFIVCKTLGSLHIPHSTQILLEALDEHPEYKRAIIRGLSFTRDRAILPKVLKIMKETTDQGLRQECMTTIAFSGDRSEQTKNEIRPYFQDRSTKDYLIALNSLVIMGDGEMMNNYIQMLVSGTEKEQYIIQKHIGKLPSVQQLKLAEAMFHYPDEETLLIVMGLQKFNVLDLRIAGILERKLQETAHAALRIEIYKLIGKHVNKQKELLPQKFLFEAKSNEKNPHILRELEQIISMMNRFEGHISVQRGE
ncbi:HEAT repeat domain-containing protein [Paenibacillus amylolyticus]|uniref:HEAT repeat domain-containing protein n=1 Tax=Paenibacillus amylolyticus TaxID=1451 RepID=UPI0039B08BE1